MNDSGIIRNRLKIEATVTNARAFLSPTEFGSFSKYMGFCRENPFKITGKRYKYQQQPQSDQISKDLKNGVLSFWEAWYMLI